jgi:HK97 family phage prohead protease
MVQQLHKGFVESFAVKDVDTKSGTLVQAYTRYNVKDSDNDYGRKGMFNKTWTENFSRIRHILNHDYTQPVGEPQKFWDDDDYAYMKSQIGTHDLGRDFIKMVDSGLIKEASYGYRIIKANKLKDGSQELLEVKLYEVSSLTGWGANEFTPVISLSKSMGKDVLLKQYTDRIEALEKFCRNTTATDSTIELLLTEIKSLQQQVISFTTDTQAEQSLEPQGLKDTELLLLNTSIEQQLLKIQTI